MWAKLKTISGTFVRGSENLKNLCLILSFIILGSCNSMSEIEVIRKSDSKNVIQEDSLYNLGAPSLFFANSKQTINFVLSKVSGDSYR
jgi:hypothetical protein